MNVFEISLVGLLVTMLGNLFVGLLICLKAPRNRSNKIFLGFISTLTLWSMLSFFEHYQSFELHVRFLLIRLDFFIAPIVAFSFLLFTNNFPSYSHILSKRPLTIIGVSTAIFSLLSIGTELIIRDIRAGQFGSVYSSGPLDTIYAGYIFLLIAISLFILFRQWQRSQGVEKLQLTYILIGTLIPALVISLVSLLMFRSLSYELRTEFNDVTTLLHRIAINSTLLFTLSTSYAILRHRLFGIRVLAGEIIFWVSTAAFLFVTFYSVALLELEYLGSLVSPSAITLNVFLAFLIALILNIYGKKLRRAIRRYIVNISFDPVQVKEQFLADISVATDTDEILTHLTGTTKRLYSPSNQGILVAHTAHNDHVTTHWKEFLPQQVQLLENPDNLNLLLNTTHGKSALLTSQIVKNEPDSPLAQLLDALDTEIIIPLEHQGIYVLYLLGRKTNNHAYTNEDLTLLEQLCYYTVLNLARTT